LPWVAGVPVFAVRLGETPYGFIGRFQAFNGNGKGTEDLARELFDSYRKNKQTQRKMGEVIVGLFEERGAGPSLHYHDRGCPIRRVFRRVGATDSHRSVEPPYP
jgi:hypothetical protein